MHASHVPVEHLSQHYERGLWREVLKSSRVIMGLVQPGCFPFPVSTILLPSSSRRSSAPVPDAGDQGYCRALTCLHPAGLTSKDNPLPSV